MPDFLEMMQTMATDKPEIELKPAGENGNQQSNENSQQVAEPAKPATEANKPNAEAAKPNSEQPPATPVSTGAAADPQEVPDELFFSRLSKLTDGVVKSQAEFEALLKERKELADQVAKGIEPKFANERAKWAHKILSSGQGDELQAAARTIRALTFNPEGKEGREVLFEAFILDPRNADLTNEKALQFFNASFDKNYGDIEGDVIKQRELDLAIRDAKANILKIQSEFNATEEKPIQMAKEVEEAVKNAVNGFTGLKLKFSDNAPETEVLNLAIDNPQELQQLQNMVLQPDQAYAELASRFGDEKNFDYKGFAQELWKRANHEKISKLAYEHGFKLGQLAKINEARNATDPKDLSKIAQPPGGETKDSLLGAWGKAAGQ